MNSRFLTPALFYAITLLSQAGTWELNEFGTESIWQDNPYFEVALSAINENGKWEGYNLREAQEAVEAVFNYLDNTFIFKTGVPKVTIKLGFDDISAAGNTYAKTNKVNANTLNGINYTSVTNLESYLKLGNSTTLEKSKDDNTGYTADAIIIFNYGYSNDMNSTQNLNYYSFSEQKEEGKYDFRTVLLHEMTHALGVTPSTDSGKTAWQALQVTEEGKQHIHVSDAGVNYDLTLTGSDNTHIQGNLLDGTLMLNGYTTGTVIREYSAKELAVLKEMGWEIIPEPSTSSLVLLALSGLLLRRRRS